MTKYKAIAVTEADKASERPLNFSGTMCEKNIVAGIPAMINAEAAKPANVEDMPPVSSILGSQFIKP